MEKIPLHVLGGRKQEWYGMVGVIVKGRIELLFWTFRIPLRVCETRKWWCLFSCKEKLKSFSFFQQAVN